MSSATTLPLPDFLCEAYQRGSILRENGASYPIHSNVSQDEVTQIYNVVKFLKPTNTLEIGFCLGFSGIAILQELHDTNGGKHYAIDPAQSALAGGLGLENVQRAGHSARLVFFEDYPEEVWTQIPRVQFAFIDASHQFDFTMLDFALTDKRLDVGGVIGFHDTWMGSLQKVIRFILKNRDYSIFVAGESPPAPANTGLSGAIKGALRRLPRSSRLFSEEILTPWTSLCASNMIFLKKENEDTRDWRHFIQF